MPTTRKFLKPLDSGDIAWKNWIIYPLCGSLGPKGFKVLKNNPPNFWFSAFETQFGTVWQRPESIWEFSKFSISSL